MASAKARIFASVPISRVALPANFFVDLSRLFALERGRLAEQVRFGSLSEPRAEVSHRKSGVATCTVCSPPFSFAVSVSRPSRRLAPRLPEATPRGFGWLWRFSPSLVEFGGT